MNGQNIEEWYIYIYSTIFLAVNIKEEVLVLIVE